MKSKPLEGKFNGGISTIPQEEIGIVIKVPSEKFLTKIKKDITDIVSTRQNEIRKTLLTKAKVLYMDDIGIIDYVNKQYNLKYNWNKIGRLLFVFTDMNATSIAKALRTIKKSNELASKPKANLIDKRKRLWDIHKKTMNRMLDVEGSENPLVVKAATIQEPQKVVNDKEFLKDNIEFRKDISVFDQDINKSEVIKNKIYFIDRIGIMDFLGREYGYEEEPERIGKILSVFTNLKAGSIARIMKDIGKTFITDKKTKEEILNKNYINGDVDEWVEEICHKLEIKPVKDVGKPISPLKRKK